MTPNFKHSFLWILLFASLGLSAQHDSIPFNNRLYKQEIGIDCKGIFNGNLGAALIYKVRNDRSKLIAVTYAKNHRFQFAFNSNFVVSDKTERQDGPSQSTYYLKPYKYLYVNAAYGFERVRFYNRFNFYYGVDFGPSFTYQQNGYYVRTNNNSILYYYADFGKTTSIGLNVIPFFGMKYRFSRRFSVSAETGFAFSYFLQKTELFDPYSQTVDGINTQHGFQTNTQYLRFLSFNYHFKQY